MSVDLSSLGQIKYTNSSNTTVNLTGRFDSSAISAATTLTASSSDKNISVSEVGADYTITLPTVSAGLRYKFFLDATTGAKSITITAPKAGSIYGALLSSAGATTPQITGKSSIVLSKTAVVGDSVEFVGLSDAKWSVVAICAAKDAITTA